MTESEFLAGEEPPAVSADADPDRAGAPTDADPGAAGTSADADPGAAGTPADADPGAAGAPADADPGAAGAPADADPGATGTDMDPDVEVVDGLPVLAEVRMVEHATAASLPAVQVAAVAATGFVAGAATVALVKRRTARKL